VIANSLLSVVWILNVQARNDAVVNAVGIGLLLSALAVVILIGRAALPPATRRERWLVLIPHSVYLSWLSVATIVSAAGALANGGWDGFGISAAWWTAIMMSVAAGLGLGFAWLRRDLAFTLVVMYAIAAIMLAQPNVPEIMVTGGVLLVGLGLVCLLLWQRGTTAKRELQAVG
jgi:hypothetical protein